MKTYKFKVYKSKKLKYLHQQVRIAGEVYNYLISLHKRYYKIFGKYIHKNRLKNQLVKIKKRSKFAHWKQLGSQSLQDVVDRIDHGYQKFFRRENKRPPSFRKMKKFRSFTLTQSGWKLNEESVTIGKKVYKFFKSREILGTPKRIHVKRDSLGDFYIFLVTDHSEIPPEESITSVNSVGIDFGLKTYLTLSDGNIIKSPEFFKQFRTKISTANKTLSRKQKGSKSRKQARKNLSRVHKKVVNKRLDWQVKLARDLTNKYTHIYLEDLDLNGMKKRWGRKISDLAFHQQVMWLDYQATKARCKVLKIDRFEPTSKRCNVCSHLKRDLTLKNRKWLCNNCGSFNHRDFNAALNIHDAGASASGLGNVRRELVPAVSA